MILKVISIGTKVNGRDLFLEKQRAWNAAMARQPGFLHAYVAIDESRRDQVEIVTVWKDRESLNAFMRGAHDEVERSSGIRATYDTIKVAILDVAHHVSAGPAAPIAQEAAAMAAPLDPARNSARDIVLMSESYRASMILRSALAAGLFDAIGEGGAELASLADATPLSAGHLHKLTKALRALALIEDREGWIFLAEPARRHLLSSSPTFLGHFAIHNTQPHLWERWGRLPQSLGARGDAGADNHQIFMQAMSDIAASGQADQLLIHLPLPGRQRLLDVGGATGAYSIALAGKWEELCADVLDLPATAAAAHDSIRQAGLEDRISFIVGDYRRELPDGPYDVVLLSNVLRGETPEHAERLIRRIRAALRPGGRLVIHDLFSDEADDASFVLAAFFGLHLPDCLNPTAGEAVSLMAQAGFADPRVITLDRPVVANKLVVAVNPDG